MRKRWTTKMLSDAEKMDARQFSEAHGISIQASRDGAKRYGLSFVPMERHGRHRMFYAEDVARMFEIRSEGYSCTLIADAFCTTSAHVRKILSTAREKGFEAYPPRPQTIA